MRYTSAVSALCLASIAGPVAAGPVGQASTLLARESEPFHGETLGSEIAADDVKLPPYDEVDDAVSKKSVIGTPIRRITFDGDEVVKEGTIVAAKYDTLRSALEEAWAKRPQYMTRGMQGYPHQVDPDPVPFDVFRVNRDYALHLNRRFATFDKTTGCKEDLRYACVGSFQQAICSSGGRYEVLPCKNSTVCRAVPDSHNDAVLIGCRKPAEVARLLDLGATETPEEELSLEPSVLGYVLREEPSAEEFRSQLEAEMTAELEAEMKERIDDDDQEVRNKDYPTHRKSIIEHLTRILQEKLEEELEVLRNELKRQRGEENVAVEGAVEDKEKDEIEREEHKEDVEDKEEDEIEHEFRNGDVEVEVLAHSDKAADEDKIEREDRIKPIDNDDGLESLDKLAEPVNDKTTTVVEVQTKAVQPEVVPTVLANAE